VKSARRRILGSPEMRVNRSKQKKIAEAASEYISSLLEIPENIRFDVIGILWGIHKAPEITHIESAFILEQDL
jgi:Holliday junction resolvase-like predicted endonuclease